MSEILQLYSKIVKGIIIVNIIELVIVFILGKLSIGFVLSLIFGSLISMLTFRLLILSAQKAMELPIILAHQYAVSRYYIRFFIYGVTIFVTLKNENLNVIATLIGLISPSISIKLDLLLDILKNKQKKI